jgi:hypothetical protein
MLISWWWSRWRVLMGVFAGFWGWAYLSVVLLRLCSAFNDDGKVLGCVFEGESNGVSVFVLCCDATDVHNFVSYLKSC